MNNAKKIMPLLGLLLALRCVGVTAQKQLQADAAAVRALSEKVAGWQLAHPSKKALNTWEYGTFYSGLINLYKATENDRYLHAIEEMGRTVNWELRPRPYDANVYAAAHALFELYAIKKDPRIIDKVRYTMDMPLARALEPEVAFDNNKYWWEWWTWCDALFMAPPAFAHASVLLGRPEYMTFMVTMWKQTSAYLYNPQDSLYFRDDRFFNERSANGHRVYWSRGNGWVLAGLCKVLDYMPRAHPERPFFEQQFVEMAGKIARIQRDNGYWSPSLLDARAYPQNETSGTAFFCYALAWGVNNGYLSEEKLLPAISKGWHAIAAAVDANGRPGFVQQVGDQPDKVRKEDTEVYGSGAILLAGSELLRLLESR